MEMDVVEKNVAEFMGFTQPHKLTDNCVTNDYKDTHTHTRIESPPQNHSASVR